MKRILITLTFVATVGLQAQDWGGGWGDPTPAKKGSGSSEPAATSEPAADAPKKEAEIVIPTIGTHYDDPAVPHYEPE